MIFMRKVTIDIPVHILFELDDSSIQAFNLYVPARKKAFLCSKLALGNVGHLASFYNDML